MIWGSSKNKKTAVAPEAKVVVLEPQSSNLLCLASPAVPFPDEDRAVLNHFNDFWRQRGCFVHSVSLLSPFQGFDTINGEIREAVHSFRTVTNLTASMCA